MVIVASNREAIKSGVVTLSSGRDTSHIEYAADILLGIINTAVYEGNLTQEQVVQEQIRVSMGLSDTDILNRQTVIPLKNRSGNIMVSCGLLLDRDHTMYRDELVRVGAERKQTPKF